MADNGSHARHDRFAVAASIGGGAIPATVGTCRSCSALHADLLTIRAALRLAWTPVRHRDLQLTPADGTRLRPTSLWRRTIDAIGTRRDTVTRPLALSFTGLGLAGLLLTTVPVGTSGVTTGEMSAAVDMPAARVDGEAIPPPVPDPDDGRSIIEEPLTILSIGLLGAGGALFAVRRRRASRGEAMR